MIMRILFLLLLFAPLAANAQLSMREAFLQMPDTLLPYLSASNRLDMLDYYDAKMKSEVTNELQGKSELLTMTADSLSLRMNVSHDMTLYLIEAAEEVDSSRQVIAVSHVLRLSTGEEDRTLTFYSNRWRQLTTPPHLLPLYEARLPKASSTLLRRDEEVMSK